MEMMNTVVESQSR